MGFFNYLQTLSTFFVGIIAIVVVMLVYVYIQVGKDLVAFKKHFATTGDGAWGGIIKATLVVILFTLIAWMINHEADAAELKWFDQTTVYAGVDYTKDVSPQCVVNAVDDRLTSNVGFRQNIVRKGDIVAALNYTHHSCAVGVDNHGYDGVGMVLEWRLDKK